VLSLADELVVELCTMPPNIWTQYSSASQGKVLSIPGLIKFHMLQGATTDIWQRKDRGGRRVLCVCIVLDLTPSQPLDAELL